MLIGIDGYEANVGIRVGIGEFAFEITKELYRLRSKDRQFKIFLKGKPLEDMPKEDEYWKYRIVYPKKFWTRIGLPFALLTERRKPDVLFTPTHYAPKFSTIPQVISVMDLSFIFFPELFNKKDLYKLVNWTKSSVNKSKRVITISESSKNDIIEEYKIPGKNVAVIYPGLKPALGNKSMNIKEKYGLKDYILFVGTLQPRKNIKSLTEAFSKISNNYSDLSLVVAGKKGWLYEEILEAPKVYGVEDKVKFLDFVPDEDLPSLYSNAKFMVLPSLYEGFGLPVLEAMKYDCPVITSNVSSLPEAGGDAALYVDPNSVDDIAEKMKKLMDDEGLRTEMISKGREQIKKFSWEKAAKETLKVLEGVANA